MDEHTKGAFIRLASRIQSAWSNSDCLHIESLVAAYHQECLSSPSLALKAQRIRGESLVLSALRRWKELSLISLKDDTSNGSGSRSWAQQSRWAGQQEAKARRPKPEKEGEKTVLLIPLLFGLLECHPYSG